MARESWIERLYNVCRKEPFRKKVIVAESYNQGDQWLTRMCREHGPVLNTEIVTIRSLAVKSSKWELLRAGVKLLNADQTFWIVHNLLLELSQKHAAYLPSDLVSPGIVSSFHHAIQELRCASMHSDQLWVELFESRDKGAFVIELLQTYEEFLNDKRNVDFAGLLQFIPQEPNQDLYIIPGLQRLSPVELEMLTRMAGDGLTVVERETAFPEDLGGKDGRQIKVFQAVGSLAEIREVLRRICTAEIPFDQVEIIASDYDTYANAIYTLCCSLDIPCTFSRGIPAAFFPMGKAALAYLAWLECNFDVDCFLKALKHDVISFRKYDENVSTVAVIRCLEKSGIGWGRERYAALNGPAKLEELGDHAAAYMLAGNVFSSLFAGLPENEPWTPVTVVRGMIGFLEQCANVNGEADAEVLKGIYNLLESLQGVNPQTLSNEQAFRYVKEQMTGFNVLCRGPKEGSLYVSSLHDGGESGRKHTFLVGMNESSWSSSVRQDPVLLDSERMSVGNLPPSNELAKQRKKERSLRLGQICGSVTLSYRSYDPAEQKQLNAAYELLQVCRLLAGDPEMDYSGMEHVLGNPVGYYPGMDEGQMKHHLDSSDRWMHRLIHNHRIKDGTETLQRSFPFAAEAYQASVHRDNPALSAYDGLLDVGDFSVQYKDGPETHISVTQLEKYAVCPMQYFYSAVLKVREKDAATFDRSIWLNPADRGSLLHDIFCDYMKQAVDGSADGVPKHDAMRLREITEITIERYKQLVPPPSPHIFQKECESMRRDVQVFYTMEQQRTSKPKFFELELAIDGQPLKVDLGGGLSLNLRGFVDRVDEVGPSQYKIYDYKTGSPYKYDENKYFSAGTQLQHALYAVAVEQWMIRNGTDPSATVTESAYYFPTERGRGEEVNRLQNRREELAELVGHLLESMETGVFLPTYNTDVCKWCSYKEACGSQPAHMKDKWDALENEEVLRRLLEVSRFA